MGPSSRPIITLDGDLYDSAVKLKDYKKQWCIRLGGLHTIMAALKCLGKYIDPSGLDLALGMASVYGSATVHQILEGRHIYRGIEAHMILATALFHLLCKQVFAEEHDDLKEELSHRLQMFNHYMQNKSAHDAESFRDLVTKVSEQLTNSARLQKLEDWEKVLRESRCFFVPI